MEEAPLTAASKLTLKSCHTLDIDFIFSEAITGVI